MLHWDRIPTYSWDPLFHLSAAFRPPLDDLDLGEVYKTPQIAPNPRDIIMSVSGLDADNVAYAYQHALANPHGW